MKYGVWAIGLVVMFAFATPASALQETPVEEAPTEETPATPAEAPVKDSDKKKVKESEEKDSEEKDDEESDKEEAEESKLDTEKALETIAEEAKEKIEEIAEEEVKPETPAPTAKSDGVNAGVVEKLGSGKPPVENSISTALEVPEEAPRPWAGSSFSINNSYNTNSFFQGTNPDWRPNYRVNLGLRPVWVLNDTYSFSGRWGFAGSFYTDGVIESDSRIIDEVASNQGQDTSHQTFSSSDLTLTASAGGLYSIPVLDAGISADLSLTLPTSDYSLFANPMYFGLAAGTSVSRSFSVVKGLRVSYSLGFNKTFYESYDGAVATSSYASGAANCFATEVDDAGVARCLSHGGFGQPLWGIDNGISSSLKILDWLSVAASWGLSHSLIKDFESEDPRISFQSQESTSSVRYLMSESLSATFSSIPMLPYLTISAGFRGVHGTLGADAEYLHPFDGDYLNYLRAFVNFNFNVGSLVDQFGSLGGNTIAYEHPDTDTLATRSNQ